MHASYKMQRIESLANFNVVSELNQSQDQNSHIKNPLYNTYIISDLCNLSYKNSMIHQVKDHKLNIHIMCKIYIICITFTPKIKGKIAIKK